MAPPEVRYIKLGAGGQSARHCIENGEIGLGFDEISHELCLRGAWGEVRQTFLNSNRSPGKATAHTTELRAFYELGPETLWITFADKLLWWTFAEADVRFEPELKGNLPRRRTAISGWSSTDALGRALSVGDLNPRLTTVAYFKSTICSVKEAAYVVRRINGLEEPIVTEAAEARKRVRALAERLITNLHWRDFEILTDLIFSASGWRRVSVLGKTEADLDLMLEQIATGERAFVQVKSRATPAVLADYVQRFRGFEDCDRMFFVCHSPSPNLKNEIVDGDVNLWFADTLAERAVRAGLFDWLVERAR